MGYTVVEHDLVDKADTVLGDAAFRILILLLRETKAAMRWGSLPGNIADDEMPFIRLGLKRLGWNASERKYYTAVKELEDNGFVVVLRNPGAPIQVRLLPSRWRQDRARNTADPCKNDGGQDDTPCQNDRGTQEYPCKNDGGNPENPCQNVGGFAPIQYIYNTPNTSPLPALAKDQSTCTNSGEGDFAIKKKETMQSPSKTEQDEALPLLDVLHRRYCDSPMPEHWRNIGEGAFLPPAFKKEGGQECPLSEFLESAEAFDALLDVLDKSWRRERETLSGAALVRRQKEMSALSAMMGDMHDCWKHAERLRDTLFLQYHRIGRYHARSGTAGSEAHLRELAMMLCRRLGLEPSATALGRLAALMRRHGRLAIVEQAEILRHPSDRIGVRDVVAVIAHRLDKVDAVPLSC